MWGASNMSERLGCWGSVKMDTAEATDYLLELLQSLETPSAEGQSRIGG